jgi:hypothetical protein
MKRYICKSIDDIKYLYDYLKINDLTLTNSLDDMILLFGKHSNMVLFVDEYYFNICPGKCGDCPLCEDYKNSEKVNINNIIRKEKLNRILND